MVTFVADWGQTHVKFVGLNDVVVIKHALNSKFGTHRPVQQRHIAIHLRLWQMSHLRQCMHEDVILFLKALDTRDIFDLCKPHATFLSGG